MRGKKIISSLLIVGLFLNATLVHATVLTIQDSDHSEASAGFDGTNHFSHPINSKTSGQIAGELVSVSVWIQNLSGSTRNTDVALLGYEYDIATDTNVNGSNTLAYSVQCNIAQVPVTGSYDDLKLYSCDNEGALTMPEAGEGNYIIWYLDVAEAFTNFSLRVKGSASDLNTDVSCSPRPGGSNKCGTIEDAYFSIDYLPAEEPDLRTRIISVAPTASTTASTTVSLSVDAYINEADFDEGMNIHVKINSLAQNSLAPSVGSLCSVMDTLPNQAGGIDCEYEWEVSSAGDFSTSTNVVFLNEGTHRAVWTLRKDSFLSSLWLIGGLFPEETLKTKVVDFIVVQQSTFDASAFSNIGDPNAPETAGLVPWFLSGGTATTATTAIESMAGGVFIFRDVLLSKFPFNWVYGIAYDIGTLKDLSTAGVPVPTVEYDFSYLESLDPEIASSSDLSFVMFASTTFSEVGQMTAFEAFRFLAVTFMWIGLGFFILREGARVVQSIQYSMVN